MKVADILDTARDAITVQRVYAPPYERDGLTVIPAAVVRGGAGGGTGDDDEGGEGEGGGLALNGRPSGAYVIKDGEVRWVPAFDVTRMVSLLGLVLVVWLLRRPRRVRVTEG